MSLGDFFSSAASGILSFGGQWWQNEKNEQSAFDNRMWQEMMSNTAYQRQVDDLGKAGLNPMLAYQRSGATTPSGGMLSSVDPITPAINTGQSAYRARAEVANIEAQADKTRSEALVAKITAKKMAEDEELSVAGAMHSRRQARTEWFRGSRERIFEGMDANRWREWNERSADEFPPKLEVDKLLGEARAAGQLSDKARAEIRYLQSQSKLRELLQPREGLKSKFYEALDELLGPFLDGAANAGKSTAEAVRRMKSDRDSVEGFFGIPNDLRRRK